MGNTSAQWATCVCAWLRICKRSDRVSRKAPSFHFYYWRNFDAELQRAGTAVFSKPGRCGPGLQQRITHSGAGEPAVCAGQLFGISRERENDSLADNLRIIAFGRECGAPVGDG